MGKSGFTRTIAIAGCIALALMMVPLVTAPAQAAPPTWTKIADNGITPPAPAPPVNMFTVPGVPFQGNITIGDRWVNGMPIPAIPVSMHTYDGTNFAKVGADGFGDNYVREIYPSAAYGNELFIGTGIPFDLADPDPGSRLYRWGGTGAPTLVPESNHGWGENTDPTVPPGGPFSSSVVPLGEINERLVVCVYDESNPLIGFRIYDYDGANWAEVAGPSGGTEPRGLGDSNNRGVTKYSESLLFDGQLILPVTNTVSGLEVWTYDGTAFTRIGKAGDPGLWSANQVQGSVAVSPVEGKVYIGTGTAFWGGIGGEIWSWDGANWTQAVGQGAPGTVTGPGFGDTNNDALWPIVRGEELYAATWNSMAAPPPPANGCRVYQKNGSSFDLISDPGFDNSPATNNLFALISSSNGQLMGFTGSPANGSEVWTTPIAPSIDRTGSGAYGTVVEIQGHDFLNQQGTGTVTFNGVEAAVNSWSDTLIEAVVPQKASTGPVQVRQSNGDSNEAEFTVTLSNIWFFAEGTTRENATDGTYEEWICLQNPGSIDANVVLTYMLDDGTTETQNVTVEKESRTTVSVNDRLGPDRDVSTMVESDQPILPERPMYFNYRNKWTGGHDVMGLPAPRNTFFFAEGTTRGNNIDGYFEEWLCIQNPGDTDAEVTVTYMLGTGQNIEKKYPVEKTSRETIDVNNDVGPDEDVSIVVDSTVPIVVERPMYFNYHNKWTGGHDVVGAEAPDTEFFFAEGTTRDNPNDGSFEEWICIQNPSDTDADVTITYYTAQKGTQTQEVTVREKSRETVDVNLKLGPDVDTSFKMESNVPVLVERPMYFNYHSIWPGGHNVMGCSAPKGTFYFAEGTTLEGQFATYIAVMNTGGAQAQVTFTYMLGDGTNIQETATVEPNQRYTRDVLADVGPNQDLSIKVEGDQPIVVERPMYFGYHFWCAGGSDTLGYGI